MKIQPFDPASEILNESGLSIQDDEIVSNEIQKLCKANGCSVEDALEQLGLLMRRAETEGVRLKAAETALKINGIFKEEDVKAKAPVINITIIGNDSKSLVNLVMPNQYD